MAVRNTDGEIVLEKWENKVSKKPKILKLPFVRGIFGFIDSMKEGYKSLMRSAEISGLEELEAEAEREKAAKKAEKKAKKAAKKGIADTESAELSEQVSEAETQTVAEEKPEEEAAVEETAEEKTEEKKEEPKKEEKKSSFGALMNVIMGVAMVLGVLLSVGLFIILPTYIYKGMVLLVPAMQPDNAVLASLVKSFFESFLRIVILVGYMALVTLMKDIRRTFMYHGAEHKTIFCYENGLELTVENVKAQRRFHPRCGTSFLILMLLVGMFISFLIDPISIAATGSIPPTWLRSAIKILLLPITMGIGYELIKLAGRHDNVFTRIISAPGMWLQRLTVLEPTDDMIECAITAFVEVIPEDQSDKY